MGVKKCRNGLLFTVAFCQLLLGIIIVTSSSIVINGFDSRRQYWHGLWTGIWACVSAGAGFWASYSKFKASEYMFITTSVATAAFIWSSVLMMGVRDYLLSRDSILRGDAQQCQSDKFHSLFHREHGTWVCVDKYLAMSGFVLVISGCVLLTVAIMGAIVTCCFACRCCGATSPHANAILTLNPNTQQTGGDVLPGFRLADFAPPRYDYTAPPPSYDQVSATAPPKSPSTVPKLPPIGPIHNN